MESKKIIFTLCILVTVCGNIFSQEENKQYIHKNLSRTTLTFSTGYFPKNKVSSVYLTGNVEYYTNNKISVRGDGYYFVNNLSESILSNEFIPNQNDGLFFGALYHFKSNSHFDPYLGLQPAIAISQSKNNMQISSITVNPLFSSVLGFNYYAKKYAHLFINARYVSGKHLSEASSPMSLNEIRFEFGLGFNLF